MEVSRPHLGRAYKVVENDFFEFRLALVTDSFDLRSLV